MTKKRGIEMIDLELLERVKNDALYDRAFQCIAGGMLSNYKHKEGDKPTFIARTEGAHFYDHDGNKYYDFCINYGPSILGRHNERFKKFLMDELEKGYTPDLKEIQIEAAEAIKKCVKGIDLIRFALCGSEANMMAVRVARGYTGKNYVVKFAGHYHGAFDFILGGTSTPENPVAVDEEREGDIYNSITTTIGRGKHALMDTMIIEFNDLPAMEKLFEERGDEIACVLLEPIPVNIYGCMPEPGYLEGVRELCTKHNVVLIFDEVITGFRLALGGAEEYFGVTPDLWTFSKAIGGGFPVAIFGGKKEVMEGIVECKTLSAGTFQGHPLCSAAIVGLTTILAENDGAILKKIARLGNMLAEGFLDRAKAHGIPLIVQGFPAAIVPVITTKDKIINNTDALENCDQVLYFYFSTRMNQLGVYNLQRYSCSDEHTEDDVRYAIEAADKVFEELEMFM